VRNFKRNAAIAFDFARDDPGGRAIEVHRGKRDGALLGELMALTEKDAQHQCVSCRDIRGAILNLQ
jgi:hypothetical protein